MKENPSKEKKKETVIEAEVEVEVNEDDEAEEIIRNKRRGFKRVSPAARSEYVSEHVKKNNNFNNKSTDTAGIGRVIPDKSSYERNSGESKKFCHFWNNMGKCTYQKCKFLHEKSPTCKYDGFCNRQKCMFSHVKQNMAFLSNRQYSTTPSSQARFPWRSPWTTPATAWNQPTPVWSYSTGMNQSTQWGQRRTNQ